MDHAFTLNGKAKTFKKFANVQMEEDKVLKKSLSNQSDSTLIATTSSSDVDTDCTEIFIEPYELTYNIESEPEPEHEHEATPEPGFTSDLDTVRSSTGLFLDSLRLSFDRFTDKQNMLARLKIHEVLYKIMYDG